MTVLSFAEKNGAKTSNLINTSPNQSTIDTRFTNFTFSRKGDKALKGMS